MEKIEETTNCSSTMEKQNQIETETNNEGENKKPKVDAWCGVKCHEENLLLVCPFFGQ